MIERKTYIEFGKQKDFSIDFLVAMMEDARVTTLNRTLEISQEELHWQYAEGWNAVSVLLSHIAAVENYFRITLIEKRKLNKTEEKEIIPGLEMGKFIPSIISKNQPIDYFIEELELSRTKMLSAISSISTAEFHKKQKGYNSNTGFNLAWALYHMAEDEIHHRGQISIVRKLYKAK